MHDERRKIIRFALDHDIHDIHTYSGYRGGLVVKITTGNVSTVNIIEEYALSLSIQEVVVKKNVLMQFEIYCITPDEDVYELKIHERKEEKKYKTLLKDDWMNRTVK